MTTKQRYKINLTRQSDGSAIAYVENINTGSNVLQTTAPSSYEALRRLVYLIEIAKKQGVI